MKKLRIEALLKLHRDGLLKDTIPFWMKHTIDREYGGFLNFLDRDGTVVCTDKPVWVLGRFTWLMATLYNNAEKRPEWLATAKHGIDFLEKHCFDTDGRMFFMVTRDGKPLQKRRYVFSEYFGSLAFSEYGMATGDESKSRKANDLFDLFIRCRDNPGLLPPKQIVATRQTKGHAMAMVTIAFCQQIRKLGRRELCDAILGRAIEEVFRDFVDYERKALLETVGSDGRKLDNPEGRCVNPGHAIETAWFILEEARERNDKALIAKACQVIDWSLDIGWDKEYGGILYFVDIEGKPCEQYEHDMKLAWPHNEALYACLLAHYLTGETKYADWYEKIHEWAYARFPDKVYGDWFKYLHRDGTVSHTWKGNRWVGPYHLPRTQLNCWKLLETMLKEAEAHERRA